MKIKVINPADNEFCVNTVYTISWDGETEYIQGLGFTVNKFGRESKLVWDISTGIYTFTTERVAYDVTINIQKEL